MKEWLTKEIHRIINNKNPGVATTVLWTCHYGGLPFFISNNCIHANAHGLKA